MSHFPHSDQDHRTHGKISECLSRNYCPGDAQTALGDQEQHATAQRGDCQYPRQQGKTGMVGRMKDGFIGDTRHFQAGRQCQGYEYDRAAFIAFAADKTEQLASQQKSKGHDQYAADARYGGYSFHQLSKLRRRLSNARPVDIGVDCPADQLRQFTESLRQLVSEPVNARRAGAEKITDSQNRSLLEGNIKRRACIGHAEEPCDSLVLGQGRSPVANMSGAQGCRCNPSRRDPVSGRREQIDGRPCEQELPHGRPGKPEEQRREQPPERHKSLYIYGDIEPVENAHDTDRCRHAGPEQHAIEGECHIDISGVESEVVGKYIIADPGDNAAERSAYPVQQPAQHAQPAKFNPVLCMHISSAIAHHRLPTLKAGKRNESLPGCKDEREMPEIPNSQGTSENRKIGDRTYSAEAFPPEKPSDVRAHALQAGCFLMAGHRVFCHRQAPWTIGGLSATVPERRD